MANGTGWKEEYLDENGKMHNGSPEKEEKFFDHIAEQIKQVVHHFAQDNKRPMRGNHAKILAGIVGAEFRLSPDIPSDLSVGFLAKPGEVYEALIRFSNAGSRFREDDANPHDLRGAAVRIMTKQGDHDFLMTNAEPHHAKDAREAMAAIMTGIDKDIAENLLGGGNIAKKIAGLPAVVALGLHLGTRARDIATALKTQMDRKVTSLATETFWSRAPIAIGNVQDPQQSVAVKYKLQPLPDDRGLPGDENDLGQELKKRLSGGAVKFLFQVQRYIDAETTPIEDATKSWESDFETIAELTIPQDAKVDDDFVNGIVFNPWTVDSNVFRPLGSMNRARKVVYPASASLR
jgi:hypothetical protein